MELWRGTTAKSFRNRTARAVWHTKASYFLQPASAWKSCGSLFWRETLQGFLVSARFPSVSRFHVQPSRPSFSSSLTSLEKPSLRIDTQLKTTTRVQPIRPAKNANLTTCMATSASRNSMIHRGAPNAPNIPASLSTHKSRYKLYEGIVVFSLISSYTPPMHLHYLQ